MNWGTRKGSRLPQCQATTVALTLILLGPALPGCGLVFVWESEHEEAETIDGGPRIAFLEYWVYQTGSGESLSKGCMAYPYGETTVDSIKIPTVLDEPYTIICREGYRDGEIAYTPEAQEEACQEGPESWEEGGYDPRCFRADPRDKHELLDGAVLDDDLNVVPPPTSADPKGVKGVYVRLTLQSNQFGEVEIRRDAAPCTPCYSCAAAFNFSIVPLDGAEDTASTEEALVDTPETEVLQVEGAESEAEPLGETEQPNRTLDPTNAATWEAVLFVAEPNTEEDG